MNKQLVRIFVAASLAAAASAQAATVMLPPVALTLNGWAYGNGLKVAATSPTLAYNGPAGAFGGTLSGAGALDNSAFITFCIELEESFFFGDVPMLGYSVVDGQHYFQQRRGDAGISDRLGKLMTYAADNAGLVNNAAGSTALQLAVWNIVYDNDQTLASSPGARFSEASVRGTSATGLLAGAQAVSQSRFSVFALERAGSQDFLVITPTATVPESGTLGLVAAALAGLALTRRRRA